MSSALSKKQLISLLILLGLIFVLPLSLLLTKQRQEVRKKAAVPEGVLQIKIEPASTSLQIGGTVTLTVKIYNGSVEIKKIRVAGVELTVSPSIGAFTISDINCGSTWLSSKAFGDTTTGKIRLICYKLPTGTGAANTPAEIAPGATQDLGSFKVIALNAGTFTFSSKISDSGRTNIPEDINYFDLSNDLGTPATITVGGGPTITPGPTNTPIPTPTGATPTPGGCPNGEFGNLNCDSGGLIDITDLSILLDSWNSEGPAPTPFAGRHSADICCPIGHPDNLVDISDLSVLLDHWKSE